ncbi:MAG TPA: DUF72 domain-containing protein [Aeromicrobium sp.]|nr:DUF72 domain-containing protein [Aeromicrobium sp.]
MASQHEIHVGISGWDYASWRGDFYPQGLPARERLPFAASRFSSIEVNGSFYSLQRPSTYERWRELTPDGFVFALKGGRYITHLRRLREVEPALANFFASGPLALGPRLGPILWQLPASMEYDASTLRSFVELLPASTAAASRLAARHDAKLKEPAYLAIDEERPLLHAIEPRSRTFDTPEFYDLLADHGMACVPSDSPRWPLFEPGAAPFTYVRLHGHSQLYASRYSGRLLDHWAERCRDWARGGPVFVYFDNDMHGHAPWDALRLLERLGVVRAVS